MMYTQWSVEVGAMGLSQLHMAPEPCVAGTRYSGSYLDTNTLQWSVLPSFAGLTHLIHAYAQEYLLSSSRKLCLQREQAEALRVS